MKLYEGSRLAVWVVEGRRFDALGERFDTRTALGWRTKYAPDAEITLTWENR